MLNTSTKYPKNGAATAKPKLLEKLPSDKTVALFFELTSKFNK